jgi:hypothetical protein
MISSQVTELRFARVVAEPICETALARIVASVT